MDGWMDGWMDGLTDCLIDRLALHQTYSVHVHCTGHEHKGHYYQRYILPATCICSTIGNTERMVRGLCVLISGLKASDYTGLVCGSLHVCRSDYI